MCVVLQASQKYSRMVTIICNVKRECDILCVTEISFCTTDLFKLSFRIFCLGSSVGSFAIVPGSTFLVILDYTFYWILIILACWMNLRVAIADDYNRYHDIVIALVIAFVLDIK